MIIEKHRALLVIRDVYSKGRLDLSISPGHEEAPRVRDI